MGYRIDNLSILSSLEKEAKIDIDRCNLLAKNEVDGVLTSIYETEGRYFRIAGDECREIFKNDLYFRGIQDVYEFTPDDFHVYFFHVNKDRNQIMPIDVYNIEKEQVVKGVSCHHNGLTVTYNDKDSLIFQTVDMCKIIKVKESDEFIFSIKKTQVNAIDGAKGLFIFLDNIAERDKFSPFGGTFFDKFKTQLPYIKEMKEKSGHERE